MKEVDHARAGSEVGNSLALRIPKPFAKEVNVRQGTEMELSVADGKLVAVPVRRGAITLEQLLAGITDENIHAEVDFGRPVGREIW